jgi:ABC-2 type transport system ATP-binding protein
MIAVKSLQKRFGKHEALKNLTFQIGSGSIFGLVGSNGAGKSTLLRTIAGIYQPDGGCVEIDGNPSFENPKVKARISFIPDYPYFLPQSTVHDTAALYRRLYPGWDEERYRGLCAMFPIDARAKINNMSKGMQRQAALILALSSRPDYLLMDEIFDGLDPVIRQLLRRVVAEEVGARGVTVVIASHNLRELEDLCDHVGLMHEGGILFEQELDSLKLGIHKVQAAYLPALPREAFAELNLVKFEARGSLVHLVARGEREEILEKLRALHPVFLEALPLTLEEVFISEMEVAGYDLDNVLQ